MSSLVRDVVPILAIAGLILGFGLLIGLFVALVARFESYRVRRSLASVVADLTEVRSTPAILGPAWKLECHEGLRAGYRIALSFGVGRANPWTGGGPGPNTLRTLHLQVDVVRTLGALPDALGPGLTEPARTSWAERIRVEPGNSAARFTMPLPHGAGGVAEFWNGVRYAAERLEPAPRVAPRPSPAEVSGSAPIAKARSVRPRAAESAGARAAPAAAPAVRAKRPPPPTWISLDGAESPGEATFVLCGATHDMRCRGAVFVGPFAIGQAGRAWARLEEAYGYSGATFFVFGCIVNGRADLDALRAGARSVMGQMTIYCTDRPAPMERYVVAAKSADGLLLEPDDTLPTFPDADAAVRDAVARGNEALALVALERIAWHLHM